MMRRFFEYIEKIFQFSEFLGSLADSRQKPHIPSASIWIAAFIMFVTRKASLNRLENELRFPKRFEKIIGKKIPSADRIGDVFCLLKTQALRDMLAKMIHRLKRNKALDKNGSYVFAAVDGHEFFSQ